MPMRSRVDQWSNTRLQAVRVHATARLHLGFLDLNGNLGRRFGSLGVALDDPVLDILIERARELSISGPEPERLAASVRGAVAYLGTSDHVRVGVHRSVPSHAGLG